MFTILPVLNHSIAVRSTERARYKANIPNSQILNTCRLRVLYTKPPTTCGAWFGANISCNPHNAFPGMHPHSVPALGLSTDCCTVHQIYTSSRGLDPVRHGLPGLLSHRVCHGFPWPGTRLSRSCCLRWRDLPRRSLPHRSPADVDHSVL